MICTFANTVEYCLSYTKGLCADCPNISAIFTCVIIGGCHPLCLIRLDTKCIFHDGNLLENTPSHILERNVTRKILPWISMHIARGPKTVK